MKGFPMLDKIPASARHALIVLLAAVLTTVGQVFSNHQSTGADLTLSDVLWGLGAAVVTQLLLWVTPLTQQYGVGAANPPVVPEITPGNPPVD